MKKIEAREKSLADLLTNKKYTIHYYQREYRWGTKQVLELISDLTDEFFNNYKDGDDRGEGEKYGFYYMGSVILTGGKEGNAIIDGQQRLTTITLLLMYLNHMQTEKRYSETVDIRNMIFSDQYGKKSFNLNVEERIKCLDAIFQGKDYDLKYEKSESVKNIFNRFHDIEDNFPEEILNKCLIHFIDWLIYKVYFVEINANTEQDAHKVFVTMNDRGLNLTPTEMLKGYLLSEISNNDKRNQANDLWKEMIYEINKTNPENKEVDDDFIKNWLRAQYAKSIRESKKGAESLDFDLIGTEFHKWVLTNAKNIGLNKSVDYEEFILEEFKKYANVYIKLRECSIVLNPDFEYVYYNANRNFTLQYQLILSSIDRNDGATIIDRKIKIVSCFIDQYITRRAVNYKVVDYSSIKNAVFNLTRKFRRLPVDELKNMVTEELKRMEFKIDGIEDFSLTNFTARYMLHILARITYYVELQSEVPTASFVTYVDRSNKNSYDIEHILGDNFIANNMNFVDEDEFKRERNRFGALILLPKDKNRSIKDRPYKDKLKIYMGENLLAKSLHPDCYKNNPRFLIFKNDKNLNFKSYDDFNKKTIGERQSLYLEIAKNIWDFNLINQF